mgnify:CR=1 FL=1
MLISTSSKLFLNSSSDISANLEASLINFLLLAKLWNILLKKILRLFSLNLILIILAFLLYGVSYKEGSQNIFDITYESTKKNTSTTRVPESGKTSSTTGGVIDIPSFK